MTDPDMIKAWRICLCTAVVPVDDPCAACVNRSREPARLHSVTYATTLHPSALPHAIDLARIASGMRTRTLEHIEWLGLSHLGEFSTHCDPARAATFTIADAVAAIYRINAEDT